MPLRSRFTLVLPSEEDVPMQGSGARTNARALPEGLDDQAGFFNDHHTVLLTSNPHTLSTH